MSFFLRKLDYKGIMSLARFFLSLFCISSLSFSVSASDTPSNPEYEYQNEDIIAFVGEKVSFEQNDIYDVRKVTLPSGEVVERKIPSFDNRYEASYRVIDWVYGHQPSDIIDFEVYDHYGSPQLPHIETPLVLLIHYDGRWIQSKYNNHSLSETSDGDWAVCGAPASHESRRELAETYSETLDFVEPIFKEDGSTCRTGTRASKIFEFQNKTRFIPEKRRKFCNRELGFSENILVGTGSHKSAKREGEAHKACMDRLNAQDLP